jgi:hypothetical protein
MTHGYWTPMVTIGVGLPVVPSSVGAYSAMVPSPVATQRLPEWSNASPYGSKTHFLPEMVLYGGMSPVSVVWNDVNALAPPSADQTSVQC